MKHTKYTQNVFNDEEISKSVFIAVSNLSYRLAMLYSLNRTMCFVFFFFPFFWPLCFLSIDFSLSISVFLERKTYILCHHRVIAFQTLQNISETYQKPFWELIFRTLCHILAACVWCECACIRGLRLIWISYTINDIWYGWTYQYILKQSLTLRYQWHFIDGVCVRAYEHCSVHTEQAHAQLGLTFICSLCFIIRRQFIYWVFGVFFWAPLLTLSPSLLRCALCMFSHQFMSHFSHNLLFFPIQAKKCIIIYPREQYQMCVQITKVKLILSISCHSSLFSFLFLLLLAESFVRQFWHFWSIMSDELNVFMNAVWVSACLRVVYFVTVY